MQQEMLVRGTITTMCVRHSAGKPEEQQDVGKMNYDIYEVVSGRATTEKRNVHHVADPCQWHPYRTMPYVAEGLLDILPGKAILDESAGESVVRIVKAQKPETYCVRIDSQGGYKEDDDGQKW